jgi:hypothetical protein
LPLLDKPVEDIFMALLIPVLNILFYFVINGSITEPILVSVALDNLKYGFQSLSEKYVPALL